MAIACDIEQYADLARVPGGARAPVFALPPLNRTTLVAAGESAAFVAGAEFFRITNRGESVWARVGLKADSVVAAADDPQSIYIGATGGTIDFVLPHAADPTLWAVDIRATA